MITSIIKDILRRMYAKIWTVLLVLALIVGSIYALKVGVSYLFSSPATKTALVQESAQKSIVIDTITQINTAEETKRKLDVKVAQQASKDLSVHITEARAAETKFYQIKETAVKSYKPKPPKRMSAAAGVQDETPLLEQLAEETERQQTNARLLQDSVWAAFALAST